MEKDFPVMVYSFQGIRDPLFEGLILQYLKRLNHDGHFRFHVITHEQEEYMTHTEERRALREELLSYGIHWYPVTYHAGRFLLFKKLYDFLHSLAFAVKIRFVKKAKIMFGYLTIAGAFSYLISRLLRLPLLIYCFEPHSDYMIDFGYWKKNSLKYRLLHTLEKLEATRARYLVVPTTHTLELVKKWKPRAKKIYTVPISVDTDFFDFSENARREIRDRLGFGNRKVVFYLGKTGGIYYELEDIARFYAELIQHNPEYFAFIVTPTPKEETEAALRESGLHEHDFLVMGKIPYSEVADYVSASDVGLVAIPPLPSQRYRTPVKVGNYLACGLPYIITEGIADDDELARRYRVGVVAKSFDSEDLQPVFSELDQLLKEPAKSLRKRCRKTAIKYRGLHNTYNALREILEKMKTETLN